MTTELEKYKALLEKNKALVKQFIEAMFSLEPDNIRKLMDPNCEFQLPNITNRPDTFHGEDFFAFMGNFMGNNASSPLPNGFSRVDIVEMTAEDNRVSSIVNGYATTADGKPYNNRYHILTYVGEDDLIVKHLEYLDSHLGYKVIVPIMKQSGAI